MKRVAFASRFSLIIQKTVKTMPFMTYGLGCDRFSLLGSLVFTGGAAMVNFQFSSGLNPVNFGTFESYAWLRSFPSTHLIIA